MNPLPDRLYTLLPAIYRLRDAEHGFPLQALLRVIAEQAAIVEDDITQLYENWFIETCEDWVVPYIGDLVGYRMLHDAGEPGDVTTPRDQQREKILIPRRDVANTIRYRRRKGTLALLAALAQDVAGWPARAVEFYRLLGWTQPMSHVRPTRGRTVNVRDGGALDLLGSPFDTIAHTVDIRSIMAPRASGQYNIPSVGVFVWRLQSYSVTDAPACCLEEIGQQCYTFSVLGSDTPLYNRPQPETEPTHPADVLNLPTPIRRRAFGEYTQTSDPYYGRGKSMTISVPDWPRRGAPQPIPRANIIPADLTDWHYRAPHNTVAVDPVLGRLVFPTGQVPRPDVVVSVSYQYAFSAAMGGGEYDRPLSHPTDAVLYHVGTGKTYSTITDALKAWQGQPRPRAAVIEISDSGLYEEQLHISLQADESLQIRAANGARPVLRLLDYHAARPDPFTISGARGSRVTLDGLLITGRSVQVTGPDANATYSGAADTGDLCDLTIRHCTFVPGWGLHCDCEPKHENEPSLILSNTRAHVRIEHSITGGMQVVADDVHAEPMQICISDSIVDATSTERVALGAANRSCAHAALTIVRCTVLGQIQTHAITLAENCIFRGVLRVARRQHGCMRFCYVTPGSRTPRRYECQPDLVEKAAGDEAAKQRERMRVEPQLNSMRYGTPTYGQLALTCADEITRGADDEAEMGAFHDLYQPQRAANLRARLDEYTPAGMEAGILYAS